MSISDKRKRIEALVLNTINTLDPSGANGTRYKAMFSKMSDAMFSEWMEALRRKEVQIDLEVPNMTTMVKMENILKAGDSVGLQLFQRIKMWDSVTRRYYMTPHAYLILKLPVRRLKQYLMDKLSVPDSDKVTNALTGQVAKPDKGSAISMTEAQTLDSKGLSTCLTELTNVRSGNQTAYAQFKSALEETGRVTVGELNMSGGIRSAQVARALLEAMHLDNNL